MPDNHLLRAIETHLNNDRLAESLQTLFCETLRWGAPRGMAPRTLEVRAPGVSRITLHPLAQLAGLPVFRVNWPADRLPGVTARRAVQRALKPIHIEHLICYVTPDGRQAAFTWARRRSDERIELRTLSYEVGAPARTTIERLGELAFSLEDLGLFGEPPITTVIDRLNRAFDVEQVTRQFYQEIANWYFWARDSRDVTLPKDVRTDEDRALFFIRLLARLIFCWFLRKKRDPRTGQSLLPDDLFDERAIPDLLKDPSPNACTYYPAILQNLFFATLNTEMDRPGEPLSRRFINPGNGRSSDDHMIHTLWRNATLLKDPDAFASLLRRVPFLNGGLFDCLDDRAPRGNSSFTEEIRIDGFSNDPAKHPKLPNYLFFGAERTVDLSAAYGDAAYRRVAVRPLLAILSRYNFTLTENTPLEQEVALDPELLGHVFENLLAAYNPETGVVARKATGSFYTPRVIVDWMVDQALTAYLDRALATLPGAAGERPDPRLATLLAWDDEAIPDFDEREREALIDAIDRMKVIDPACGSGAFPMGMLQKLVHTLRKLDPQNQGWRRRQEAALAAIHSPTAREEARRAIERAFARNNDDYGRKLYLIENCLYGVDIQPIACQLTRLRFFIALIVDQEIDPAQPNYGILPLPNLETRIVAANTLLELSRGQLRLADPRIRRLEAELQQVRHDYFTARRYRDKKELRRRDRALCDELARLLAESGDLTPADTRRVVAWNPYNPHIPASFFDPAWMFGLTADGSDDGPFDIAIGNPPYVRQEQLRGVTVSGSDGQPRPLKDALKEQYACYTGTADLYVYFFERALRLLKHGGVLAYITSNKYMRAAYGEKLRACLAYVTRPRAILDFGDAPIFTSIAYPCIIVAEKVRSAARDQIPAPDAVERALAGSNDELRALTWQPGEEIASLPDIFARAAQPLALRDLKPDGWRLESPLRLRLLERLRRSGAPLGEYVQGRFYYGIKTGLNDAFVVDRATRDRLIAEHHSSADVLKPFLRGRDVKRWRVEFQDTWLIFIPWHFPLHENPSIKGASKEAEHAFARDYPAIYEHLARFKSKLEARNKDETGIRYEWYALQRWGADYWREFEQPKIVYPDIAMETRFAFDTEALYPDCTLFLIPQRSQFILAILNSALNRWFFPQICPKIRGGFMRFKSIYVEQIPIPPATPEQRRMCERLVDVLIQLHCRDAPGHVGGAPVAEARAFAEEWLNGLVYELFFPDELHAQGARLFDATARLLRAAGDAADPGALIAHARDERSALRDVLAAVKRVEEVRVVEEGNGTRA